MSDPLAQLQEWFAQARAAGAHEPEAAALATATPDGRPSVRMVLLRGIDARGVAFYTNRDSRSDRQLPSCARRKCSRSWSRLARPCQSSTASGTSR